MTAIEPLLIHENSGIPVWVQIRNWLFYLIKSKQYQSGDVLPTVRELATTLGVNYNTVHKVYQDLETEGLICSRKGKRSFVADVDTRFLQLPDCPVDVVIEELIRVARDSNVSNDEVLARIKERFSASEAAEVSEESEAAKALDVAEVPDGLGTPQTLGVPEEQGD